VKYAFIREKQVAFPVAAMSRVLGVSTSGFYDVRAAEVPATHDARA
jgi:hypothetical protein